MMTGGQFVNAAPGGHSSSGAKGPQVTGTRIPTLQSSGRRSTLPWCPKEEVAAGEMQKQGPETKSLQSG